MKTKKNFDSKHDFLYVDLSLHKKWRQANKEYKAKRDKQYAEANKEKIREYQKQYREANKEKTREYDRQRNEAKRNKNLVNSIICQKEILNKP